MIVVLGPSTLASSIVGAHLGELVVGAPEDDRLGGPVGEAAEIASALPLPTRAVVVPAGAAMAEAVGAVRQAGGSLQEARVVVVGDPPEGISPSAWRSQVERLGASVVADTGGLAAELARDPDAGAPTPQEQRAMRPGAPENMAWREALRTARPHRVWLRRRARPIDAPVPEETIDAAIRRRLAPGCHTIAVISPKGGVGKTTLSFLLGSVLARVRGGRVLAVDTNPDFGSLADLMGERVPATISDLIRDLRFVHDQCDLANYVSVSRTGLHVLAAPQDPVEMERLGSGGYRAITEVLRRHYDLVVFDCGTGFLDDITQHALHTADAVVLVSAAQLVSAKIVMQALDRLSATGFDTSRSTLALNMVRGDETLDRRRLRTALAGRVGAVAEVPNDLRMQRDIDLGEFSYARLQGATRTALRRLAAEVVGRLPGGESDTLEIVPPPDRSADAQATPAPESGGSRRDTLGVAAFT